MTYPSSAIIIAGMHRSGTSLMASLLESAGVNIGDRLMPPAFSNAKGHFENLDFVEFHESVFRSQGLGKEGWTTVEEIHVPPQLIDTAREVIEKNSGDRYWGWKDPRTTLFLDFWQELLPNAYFFFPYRSPWGVVDSLYRRSDETFHDNPGYAISIWHHYNQKILEFYNSHPAQCILVDIDQAVKEPGKITHLINQKFGFDLEEVAAGIYERELLKPETEILSYRRRSISQYFPEALSVYKRLQESCDLPSGSFLIEDDFFEPESLKQSWILYDWMLAHKVQRELLNEREFRNEIIRKTETAHAEYQTQISSLNQEIQRLNESYSGLAQHNNQVVQQLDEKKLLSLNLIEESQLQKERLHEYHVALSEAKSLLSTLEQDLASKDSEVLEREENCQSLEKQVAALNAQIAATNQQLETASNQLETTDQQLDLTEQQLETTNQQLETTEQKLETASNQLETTDQQLDLTEQQLETTNQQLETTEQKLGTVNQQLGTANQQLEATQAALLSLQTELEHTRVALKHHQLHIEGVESSSFWKLRSQWFKLRRVFGLRDETAPVSKLWSLPSIPGPSKVKRAYQVWRERGTRGLVEKVRQQGETKAIAQGYAAWAEAHTMTETEAIAAKKEIERWSLQPTFSIIMPVYNVDEEWLTKAVESVQRQVYPHWELCIADDKSPSPHVAKLLKRYAKKDSRIKVVFRQENGNISAASNSALEIATGDYIALLDNDDELSIDALYENAKLINQYPDADFIYSDEDKINTQGERCDPFFKPDWSPDYFHSCMYTCHLGVYRTQLIRDIGGFRSDFDGSQDYDLVLRVTDKTQNIHHISKILYHWRIIPSSVTSGEGAKPWAYEAAQRALEDMLQRSSYPGHVEKGISAGFWRVRREIRKSPLVSIVIPSAGTTKETNKGEICLVENCVSSIARLSTYSDIEIIVVDGYDISQPTLDFLDQHDVRLVRSHEPFNFSHRINLGAKAAQGEFLVLLNDDTEIINADWLESMLELAQQEEIGAVGAKLFYPDQRVQHAGVLILGGNPTHAFHGADNQHPGYFFSNQVNRNYLAVTAACLMTRTSLFHELNGLDESFPLNYNDVDFCLRLHEAGYRQTFTPYAQLIHYESASRDEGLKPGEWEHLHQKWRHYLNDLHYDPYYNANLSMTNPNFELSI